MNERKGFTLMELVVVVVIVGAIAGYAIPNYVRTLERTRRDDAILQLKAIHAAQQIYRAQTGGFWPLTTAWQDITAINSNLQLNVMQSDMTFSCQGVVGGTTFTCRAVRNAPAPSYTVSVTQAAISATNPSCTAGACP